MTEFVIKYVSRDKILEMVKEEQIVRYSKNIQNIYTQQYYASKNVNYKPVNIEQEIQKYILRKFGFTDDDKSLQEYWKIPTTYWNDEEVKNNIFYMKLNIFQYSKFQLEDELIDVSLIDYKTQQPILLSSLSNINRPLVILAGSMT
jgi:hypothetical protein